MQSARNRKDWVRFLSLPAAVREEKIQKMVDDIKKTEVKVRLMLANVILIEIPSPAR